MIYILKNKEITRQFTTENGTTYPSNWLELSTEEDRKSAGIIGLTVILPELNDGERHGDYVDDYESLTRTYSVSVINVEEELLIHKLLLGDNNVD